MEYKPGEWRVTSYSERPSGASTPEPINVVRFDYLLRNIVIEYGEFSSQRENRDSIIEIIKLIGGKPSINLIVFLTRPAAHGILIL